MRIIGVITVAALILFSACGSESSSETSTRAVDIWTPFVQVLPPQGFFEVSANEPEAIPREEDTSLSDMNREERIYYETQRIYAFFGTTWLFDREADFPDFFGGRYWYRVNNTAQYLFVLIVEGLEDEAAEFLEFIEDFETTIVKSANISYNEFLYVFEQIWSSEVFPITRRSTWVNVLGGYIRVTLANYSDEEIMFFRQYISDSPLIVFKCVYETYGQDISRGFWADPPPLLNELDSISISARTEFIYDLLGNKIQDAYEFMFNVYNKSENSFQVLYSYLAAYMNGRWVYILNHAKIINTEFAPGNSVSNFPLRFSRQLDGLFKIVFILSGSDVHGATHRLEHVFEWHGTPE